MVAKEACDVSARGKGLISKRGRNAMSNLKGRDLKGVADFTAEEIELTLEVSRLLKL